MYIERNYILSIQNLFTDIFNSEITVIAFSLVRIRITDNPFQISTIVCLICPTNHFEYVDIIHKVIG